MINSPQGSRHSGEQNADQSNRANIPAQMQTEAEPVTQPPQGSPTVEVDLPLRVQIPGYEVLELLGKGGMGVVYKARQAALGRIVALKMILHAEHAGPTERQRFQTEAEAAARLQHPNIVQVFEVGTHEGLPYLALEYCPGGSLAQRIKDNPLPIREAAQMVETLAVAIHVAHSANVVHRDLNPANVLLTTTGQPKITDFGLAKKLGEPSRTQSGVVVGTPSYMSPEQAGGKTKEVGPPADIYALGAILYELLTGRPPFKAATPLDTILQVVAGEPTPVRRLRPEVPRDLETICHKCLEKEPAARYASAESLAEDLRHFLSGEPIRVRRISPWERAVKWAKRRPAAVIAAAASLAALLCLFALLIVVWFWVPFVANNNLSPIQTMLPPPPQIQQRDVPINPPPAKRPPVNQEIVKYPFWDYEPIQGEPVVQANNPSAKADNPPPTAVREAPRPAAANNDRLTAEGRDRVKRATVFLRVTMADGHKASGSGFFGCKEAPNIVLTNAHVVGMLAPESGMPKAIEVIVNSGEANEWKADARVLGVDRSSDLAVLDIGKQTQPLPEPLTIKSASGLQELDRLFVSGFPLGYSLGKEISIRDTSVSALRKKNGQLNRIQLNGGMDPGNSGGPIVNANGEVIGVAVSGIGGRQINFAIPGDHVHNILDGGISELTIHQPYLAAGNKIRAPVLMHIIDPRSLIKEVGLDVWTGDKPANAQSAHRPAATKQPAAQPGDSTHLYFHLKYRAPNGTGDLLLPELPPGKAYWQQPRWVNSKGQTFWAAATPMRQWSPPVHRKPADLVLRFKTLATRLLDLSLENTFKISNNDDDSDAIRIRTKVAFTETVVSTGQSGTVLSLRYCQPPSRQLILPDGQAHNNDKDDQFIKVMPGLVTASVQLDRLGNILRQAIDTRPLAQMDPEQVKSIHSFHERIQQALESLSVSLPPSGTVNPLDSWRAERVLPIDTPGKTELDKMDVTFTYLGTRKHDGREEAVINMDGTVQLRGKGDGISGKATGQILVDLATGQTILAETTMKLQLEALLWEAGKTRPIRVLATLKFRLQRKL